MLDGAAARFGPAFAAALASGADALGAFDAAKRAVLSVEENGMLDSGVRARVQKCARPSALSCPQGLRRIAPCRTLPRARARRYAFVDPCDGSRVIQMGPLRGRLLATPEMTRAGVPAGWRGRLAAGVPELMV